MEVKVNVVGPFLNLLCARHFRMKSAIRKGRSSSKVTFLGHWQISTSKIWFYQQNQIQKRLCLRRRKKMGDRQRIFLMQFFFFTNRYIYFLLCPWHSFLFCFWICNMCRGICRISILSNPLLACQFVYAKGAAVVLLHEEVINEWFNKGHGKAAWQRPVRRTTPLYVPLLLLLNDQWLCAIKDHHGRRSLFSMSLRSNLPSAVVALTNVE